MSDEFVPIKGYEGDYEINNQGIVRSLKPRNEGMHMARIGKPGNAVRVNLSNKTHKTESYRLDALMAKHFVPNPNGYKYLHNLSGDKSDLSHTNYEYREYPPRRHTYSREKIEELSREYLNSDVSIEQFAKKFDVASKTLRGYIVEWCEDNGFKEEYLVRVEDTMQKTITENRLDRATPVSQHNSKGVLLRSYRSLTEAHRVTGIPIPSIYRSAHNPVHRAGGFIWKLTLPKTTQ